MNKILGIILAVGIVSCSNLDSWHNKNLQKRDLASNQTPIESALNRVEDSCRITKKVKKAMRKTGKKPTYIESQNQKLQTFILDNGTAVIIDLNDCKNIKTFKFRGDKIIDSRAASGQLYFRSTRGKLYVLTPNLEDSGKNSFSVAEIGPKKRKKSSKAKKYKRKKFYSMKRTTEGEQGVLAWSNMVCSQEEVLKSARDRMSECQDEKAMVIRGKITDTKYSLNPVYKYSPRRRNRGTEIRRRNTRRETTRTEIVYNLPSACLNVSVELVLLQIFSLELNAKICEQA